MSNNNRETEKLNIEQHLRQEITMQEELKRLNSILETLLVHSKERDEKVDEMYAVYNNGTFLVSVVKWGFGTLLAVGGAYMMIKSIFHAQN